MLGRTTGTVSEQVEMEALLVGIVVGTVEQMTVVVVIV